MASVCSGVCNNAKPTFEFVIHGSPFRSISYRGIRVQFSPSALLKPASDKGLRAIGLFTKPLSIPPEYLNCARDKPSATNSSKDRAEFLVAHSVINCHLTTEPFTKLVASAGVLCAAPLWYLGAVFESLIRRH